MSKQQIKVGDIVTYDPKGILFEDGDRKIEGAKVTQYEPYSGPSGFFNQDMAVIEGVNHWVPGCHLTLTPKPDEPI